MLGSISGPPTHGTQPNIPQDPIQVFHATVLTILAVVGSASGFQLSMIWVITPDSNCP